MNYWKIIFWAIIIAIIILFLAIHAFWAIKERQQQIITPKNPIPRPACPFYGFHILNSSTKSLAEIGGNKCAYHGMPCLRIESLDINVRHCLKISDENILTMIGNIPVFAEEFNPKNGEAWEGILFHNFYKYIMKDAPC
jgi:hypothetical protein